MFRIKIEKGDSEGAVFDLHEGEVVIGRSHSAGIRLRAMDISGQHVKLTLSDRKVTVENLSKYGAFLDSTPLTEPVAIQPGQRILMGKTTVLVLEESAEQPATPAAVAPASAPLPQAPESEDTGVGREEPIPSPEKTFATPGKKPAESDDVTDLTGESIAAPPSPPLAADVTGAAAQTGLEGGKTGIADGVGVDIADEALSAVSWSSPAAAAGGAGSDDDRTRAMQTRAAGQEEIEFLKAAEHQRARTRVFMIVAAVVVACGIALFFISRRPEPETTLDWPVDANGEYLEGYVESPLGGYRIVYPKSPDSEVVSVSGGMTISASIGRRFNVPFRLFLEEVVDDRFVGETMEQSVEQWKSRVGSESGKWNFDTTLPMNLFIGEENGIPFKVIPYQREEDGSWFGIASVFRHGRRFVAVRAEVPVAERARAEELMYISYVDPSREFVRSYWEGSSEIPKGNSSEILTRVREDLRRMAPATWGSVENQLVGALRKAVLEKRADDEKEALELLISLREKETLWFNEQQCQKEASLAQGDGERLARVAELCKAVFADTRDQRFYEVRRW